MLNFPARYALSLMAADRLSIIKEGGESYRSSLGKRSQKEVGTDKIYAMSDFLKELGVMPVVSLNTLER